MHDTRESFFAVPKLPKINTLIRNKAIAQLHDQFLVMLDKLQTIMGPSAFAVLCCEITEQLGRYTMEKRCQNKTLIDYHNSSTYSASVFQFPQFVQNFPTNESTCSQFKRPTPPVIQSSLTRSTTFTHPGDNSIHCSAAQVQKSNCSELVNKERTYLKPLPGRLKQTESLKIVNCKKSNTRQEKIGNKKIKDISSRLDMSSSLPTKNLHKKRSEETKKSERRGIENNSNVREESFETPDIFLAKTRQNGQFTGTKTVREIDPKIQAQSLVLETPCPLVGKQPHKRKLIEVKNVSNNNSKTGTESSGFETPSPYPGRQLKKRKLIEAKENRKDNSKMIAESSGFETPSPFPAKQPKKRKLIEMNTVNKDNSDAGGEFASFNTPSPYSSKQFKKRKLIEAKEACNNSKTRAESSGFETPSPYPSKQLTKQKSIEAKEMMKNKSKKEEKTSGFETPCPALSKKVLNCKSVESKVMNMDNSKITAESSGFETPSPYPRKKPQKRKLLEPKNVDCNNSKVRGQSSEFKTPCGKTQKSNKVKDVKTGKASSKDSCSSVETQKLNSPNANFILKKWTILFVNNSLRLLGNKYTVDLKLVEKKFITGAIESVKKLDGNSIIRAGNVVYCLIGELKNSDDLPPEVKQLCGNGFPNHWRKLLAVWKSLNSKSTVQLPTAKETSNNKDKSKEVKTKSKKNTKSIFEQIMENDSCVFNRAVTPSALLRSVEKLNVSFNKELTPPTMFIN